VLDFRLPQAILLERRRLNSIVRCRVGSSLLGKNSSHWNNEFKRLNAIGKCDDGKGNMRSGGGHGEFKWSLEIIQGPRIVGLSPPGEAKCQGKMPGNDARLRIWGSRLLIPFPQFVGRIYYTLPRIQPDGTHLGDPRLHSVKFMAISAIHPRLFQGLNERECGYWQLLGIGGQFCL
jgi:hypothetical protein